MSDLTVEQMNDDINGQWTVACFGEDKIYQGMAFVRDFTENTEQGYYLLKYLFAGGTCYVIDKSTGEKILAAGRVDFFKRREAEQIAKDHTGDE